MFPDSPPCEIAKRKGQLVIGISGISASGKSTIADYLASEFQIPVLHLDEFFAMMRLPRAQFHGQEIGDWDLPESIDWNEFARQFNATDAPVVIIEGFILFPDTKMPKIVDALIDIEFNESEFSIALERRISRGFECPVPEDWESAPIRDKVCFTCAYFRDFVWKRAFEHPEYRCPEIWTKPLLRLEATGNLDDSKKRAREFVACRLAEKRKSHCSVQ